MEKDSWKAELLTFSIIQIYWNTSGKNFEKSKFVFVSADRIFQKVKFETIFNNIEIN